MGCTHSWHSGRSLHCFSTFYSTGDGDGDHDGLHCIRQPARTHQSIRRADRAAPTARRFRAPNPRAYRGPSPAHQSITIHHPKRTHARTVPNNNVPRGRPSPSSWAGRPVVPACLPYVVVPDYSRVVRPALSLWALVGVRSRCNLQCIGVCDDVPGPFFVAPSLVVLKNAMHAQIHRDVFVASCTRGVACNHASCMHAYYTCVRLSDGRPVFTVPFKRPSLSRVLLKCS